MKITKEISLNNFEFWGGAKLNAQELTPEQFEQLEATLEELYPDGIDETHLNDLMRFDFDIVKEWLGIESEEEE